MIAGYGGQCKRTGIVTIVLLLTTYTARFLTLHSMILQTSINFALYLQQPFCLPFTSNCQVAKRNVSERSASGIYARSATCDTNLSILTYFDYYSLDLAARKILNEEASSRFRILGNNSNVQQEPVLIKYSKCGKILVFPAVFFPFSLGCGVETQHAQCLVKGLQNIKIVFPTKTTKPIYSVFSCFFKEKC